MMMLSEHYLCFVTFQEKIYLTLLEELTFILKMFIKMLHKSMMSSYKFIERFYKFDWMKAC